MYSNLCCQIGIKFVPCQQIVIAILNRLSSELVAFDIAIASELMILIISAQFKHGNFVEKLVMLEQLFEWDGGDEEGFCGIESSYAL